MAVRRSLSIPMPVSLSAFSPQASLAALAVIEDDAQTDIAFVTDITDLHNLLIVNNA
jgi:hypothetical protein